MRPGQTTATVLKPGAAQTLAWASSYYLPAILAAPIARDLGVSVATVFAAFHGAGNGVLTIAKGTMPLALFGLCTDQWNTGALWVSATLGCVAMAALYMLSQSAAAEPKSQSFALV